MGLLIDPISAQLDLSDVVGCGCCLGSPRAICLERCSRFLYSAGSATSESLLTIYTSAAGILLALGIVNGLPLFGSFLLA